MEIAIDLASYNVVEDNRDTFLMIIEKYCDIVFANNEEARSLTGLDSQEALEEISKISATAVVKVGEEGSWLKSKGQEAIRISPLPVDCCDTTGAGDMYAAGFLYGYANGWSPQKSGALSSLLAGKVIENVGARIEKQKWPEIIKGISQMIRD
jgi:sugar/nucleoside kinase (ribokinase family)